MTKFLRYLLFIVAASAAQAGTWAQQLKLQTIDVSAATEVRTGVVESGTQDGMQASDISIISIPGAEEKATLSAKVPTMATGEEAAWTLIGSARPNSQMIGIFNDNFGEVEDKDYPVYFKPLAENKWQFKIEGLFKADVILESSLTGGTIQIAQMPTGYESQYAANEGYYSNYELYMPKACLLYTSPSPRDS